MSEYRKNNSNYDSNRWGRFMQLLPIYLTVGLLPLMVRIHIYDPNLSQFSWYYAGSAGSLFGDSFLFYRQWWFVGISAYMLLVLVFRTLVDKRFLRGSAVCIPMAVFAVFSFLSAVFSEYRGFAFSGSFEQFENVFVLMGYALIVYYAFLVIDSEQEVRSVVYVLTASTLTLGLIGTCQTFGFDIMATDFVKGLIKPAGLQVEISTKVADSVAYMTLYNPNYVGVYVAMLFPLFSALLLFTRRFAERIIYAVTVVLLLISLYGSGSKAAFLVLLVEAIIFLIFVWRPLLRHWYIIIPAVTALVAVFLLVNQYYENVYIDRISEAIQLKETDHALESIETKEDGVHFVYNGNELVVSFYEDQDDTYCLVFVDGESNGIEAVLKEDGSAYRLADERFEGFEVELALCQDMLCFGVMADGHTWYFTNQYDESTGTYSYLTEKGKFDQIVMAEQAVFGDYERIISGRGYIWSVSIPLLKEHLLLGSGADTFTMTFPQQDYLRLWRNGFSDAIMSKPHSLYLQVGIQDGVIALLAMLAFFVMYLIQSIRLYIRAKFNSYYEQIGLAIMLAVFGFAIMGISNDSSMTVSPIFWAIVGLGVWINCQVAKEQKARKSGTECVTEA